MHVLGGMVGCLFLAGVLHPKQAVGFVFPLTGRECNNKGSPVLAPSTVGAFAPMGLRVHTNQALPIRTRKGKILILLNFGNCTLSYQRRAWQRCTYHGRWITKQNTLRNRPMLKCTNASSKLPSDLSPARPHLLTSLQMLPPSVG